MPGREKDESQSQGTEKQAERRDQAPRRLEDSEGTVSVLTADPHGHFVAGCRAEAKVTESELGWDGAEHHPFAIFFRSPKLDEEMNLEKLNDDGDQLAKTTSGYSFFESRQQSRIRQKLHPAA